jgi:mannosyltransferase
VPRRVSPAWAGLLVLLFLPFLGHKALGFDEVSTYEAASRHPGALWEMLLHHTDATLGTWYWLQHPIATVMGSNAWALRLPALLAASGAVAVTARAGEVLGGRRTGALAALVLLANPVLWEYANESRPYTLGLLTASVTVLVIVRALQELVSRRLAVLYGVCALLTVYLQALFVLLLLAQGVALLVSASLRQNRARLLAPLAVAGLLTLPLAIVARTQSVQTSWIPYSSPYQVVAQTSAFFGSAGALTAVAAAAWLALLALAARQGSPTNRELLALGLGPPAALVALGVRLHILRSAYVLDALVPLSLAAAAGAVALLARRPGLRLPVIAALVLLAVGGFATEARRANLRENLRGPTSLIAAHAKVHDGLLYAPDWTRVGLSFWLQRAGGTRPTDLALRPVADVRDVPTLYLPERSRDDVLQAALERQRIWVVGYPRDKWRPTANTGGDVATELRQQGFHVTERRDFGITGVMLLEKEPAATP